MQSPVIMSDSGAIEAAIQGCIDSLSAHIALVDESATIQLVNAAWRRFADSNGSVGRYGIGRCYFDFAPNDEHGISTGLRAVLSRSIDRFEVEYPCHSPAERRWFLLTITPYVGSDALRATIAHEDISRVKLADEGRINLERELSRSFESTIAALATALEQRDPYTAGHQRTVAKLSEAIAHELALSPSVVRGVRLGALIHDIGKIHVPAEILNRPGKLSPLELELVRTHAEAGFEIVRSVRFPWPVADIVRFHHERMDGSGYPLGLRAEQIPIEARIVAVADVFDAITSHRPYRAGFGAEVAMDELQRGRASLYDSDTVDALEAAIVRDPTLIQAPRSR